MLAFVLVFIAATSGVTASSWWRAARDDLRNLMARAALGAALGLTLLLGACAAAPVEPVATDQVDLPPSYRFEPEVITVADGTTVTWTNHDNFTHNVRLLDDGGDTMELAPGESVADVSTGEHRYDCSFHPNDMHRHGHRHRVDRAQFRGKPT